MNIDRTRRWGFILLFLGFAVGVPGILMLVAHQRYEATARIKLIRTLLDPVPTDGSGNQAYDPYFIQTEFEVLKSEAVLNEVVTNLHLDDTWAKRYNYGRPLERSEIFGLLRQSLRLEPVRNTTLIDITFTSEDPPEAANVANAIAQRYFDLRLENFNIRNGAFVGTEEILAGLDQTNKILQAQVGTLKQQLNPPASPGETPDPKYQPYWDALEHLNASVKFRNTVSNGVDDLEKIFIPANIGQIISPAQTPTAPANLNQQRVGRDLLLAGLLIILGAIRLLWRAYFSAPTS